MGDLNTPSLSGSIQRIIDAALASAHIGMPARVESYDASQQRVSVKPIIRRGVVGEDGERFAESIPMIEDIPVIFFGAGLHKMTFPISKGDIVWLLFGEGSLDKWLAYGASDVDPDDDRRNALSDAVAIPGIMPFASASDQTHATATVISAPEILLGSKDATELAGLKSDHATLKSAISGAAVFANDGGAAFKANILSALTTYPVGATKVKVE